jgi:hypothetical protein
MRLSYNATYRCNYGSRCTFVSFSFSSLLSILYLVIVYLRDTLYIIIFKIIIHNYSNYLTSLN